MRIRQFLPVAATVTGVACVAAWPAGALAAPKVPAKLPKVTSYRATLDVAGYITVRQHRDTTGECAPGRDMVIEYQGHAELGRPKAVTVRVVNGVTTSTFAVNPGGAVHRAAITSYSETNWCRPTEPSPPIGAPTCRARLAGALRAHLAPTPEAPSDLTPLSRGVSIALFRSGGGNQDLGCRDFSDGLTPSVGPHVLDVWELDKIGVIVPLGVSDVKVRTLRRGTAIRRSITLNGACDHVLVRTATAGVNTANAFTDSCTVTGRIHVHLKRSA